MPLSDKLIQSKTLKCFDDGMCYIEWIVKRTYCFFVGHKHPSSPWAEVCFVGSQLKCSRCGNRKPVWKYPNCEHLKTEHLYREHSLNRYGKR